MSKPRNSEHAQRLATMSWWQKQGYRSKPVEFVLYFLCVSGLALWEGFAIPWVPARGLLASHFLVSLLLFPYFVLPFCLAHRELLRTSRKRFLKLTGRIIELLLIASLASGLYLSFIGNRGDFAGQVAYWAHLGTALPIGMLILFHAQRWSMLKHAGWLAMLMAALLAAMVPAFAQESGSLLMSKDKGSLYSANLDAGSVSRVSLQDGRIIAENRFGRDIRRIALSDDGRVLAATDYLGHALLLADGDSLAVKVRVSLPKRPFGVVYDAANGLFWVSAFESHQLYAVSRNGEVKYSLSTAETPRGLALLEDGRLLVSHAMIGAVSIYDTRAEPPVLTNFIQLHESRHEDEFVSQGLPRLLDDIAVSPDGKEAWLPHVLWNFDHPFQFQSTVFPAISLISLEPGKEREHEDRRKQLFRQINVVDGNNRTRIVSNPHDGSFSADGRKYFVTFAGSEDLAVFDLTRRKSLKKRKRSGRRKGKLSQGGAKVSQILRHLPGDNPRGLLLQDDTVYVQNAMSLDLTRVKSGGKGAFARARVDAPSFARLVKTDPLPDNLRAGKTLFHSANTDKRPDHPMTGDFWMSCQSCHLDGFNFTNGYLFRAVGGDKFERASIGHEGLVRMIAGDYAGDYLRIIKQTQGGMGEDRRDDAEPVYAADPPDSVHRDMENLRRFVTARENMPYGATWLRLDAPDKEQIGEEDWINSADCAECHNEAFNDWSDSLHRLMGESNPYYQFLEDYAAETEGEPFRQWCMGCHMPQALLSGWPKTGIVQGHMFEKGGRSLFEAARDGRPDLDEGTGCLFCHRITELEAAKGHTAGANASLTVNLKDRERYLFEDNSNAVLNWAGNHQINARPGPHAASYSQPFYKESRLCSSCHNEFAPGTGAVIVDTYGEWEASSYNAPDDPARHRSCIDCHMHGDIARIGEDVPGVTTNGGRVKKNAVTHNFTGANHFLVGLRNEKLERMSIELLQSAAELEVRAESRDAVIIRIKNTGTGHALPTGVADFRQLWLEVRVTDAKGRLVLTSGEIGEGGALTDGTRLFQKVFGDHDGNPVGLAFWRYEKMLKDTKIPADGFRDEVFPLPSGTSFPVKVESRLMFRVYPQWVTDAVRQRFPDLPNPEPVEMSSLTTEITPYD